MEIFNKNQNKIIIIIKACLTCMLCSSSYISHGLFSRGFNLVSRFIYSSRFIHYFLRVWFSFYFCLHKLLFLPVVLSFKYFLFTLISYFISRYVPWGHLLDPETFQHRFPIWIHIAYIGWYVPISLFFLHFYYFISTRFSLPPLLQTFYWRWLLKLGVILKKKKKLKN